VLKKEPAGSFFQHPRADGGGGFPKGKAAASIGLPSTIRRRCGGLLTEDLVFIDFS